MRNGCNFTGVLVFMTSAALIMNGAQKTAKIIWRFVNGKRVSSNEREAVKAFIGITAISAACGR